jgi:hypothetical protein
MYKIDTVDFELLLTHLAPLLNSSLQLSYQWLIPSGVQQIHWVSDSGSQTNATTTPRVEQIECFLSSIVSRVVPRSRQVPSYKWLQHGLRHLVDTLVFYFKEFTLSTHEAVRLATTINQLFGKGKLT